MPKHLPCKIIDGQLTLDRKNLRYNTRYMPEGEYIMILVKTNENRSKTDWQKYYRYVMKEMSLDSGYDPDELHEMAKTDVLMKEMKLDSTTKLDEKSWPFYMEHLGDWALENFDFLL